MTVTWWCHRPGYQFGWFSCFKLKVYPVSGFIFEFLSLFFPAPFCSLALVFKSVFFRRSIVGSSGFPVSPAFLGPFQICSPWLYALSSASLLLFSFLAFLSPGLFLNCILDFSTSAVVIQTHLLLVNLPASVSVFVSIFDELWKLGSSFWS